MERETVNRLENLLQENILLLNDLLNVLQDEREALRRVDLDRLWRVSRIKEEACTRLKTSREKIATALGLDQNTTPLPLGQMLEQVPGPSRPQFHKLYLRILRLRDEIEILRRENLSYIDDTLRFLNEMISVFTGNTKAEVMYNSSCHLRSARPHQLLNREV